MTDDIDVEALLEEAMNRKPDYRKDDRRSKNMRHRDRSRSRDRSRRSRDHGDRFRSDRDDRRSRRGSFDNRGPYDRRDASEKRGNDRYGYERGGGHRDYRRKRTPSPISNRVPIDEMEPLTVEERDARTIFMRQIPKDARIRDIENFFRPIGKIRDVKMITDRNSHRPKGICYVEFQKIDAVSQAIRMSGERLLDQPVIIQATMAEKNRAAMEAAALSKQYGPTKVYVGALHSDITEPMLKAIFEPFGAIDYIQLQYDHSTGESKGFGFVQFKDPESARYAVEKLHGVDVAGKPIKVCHVNEKADFNFVLHDDFTKRSGVRPAGSGGGSSATVASSVGTSVRREPPSSCVQISNAFDSFQENEQWVKDVEKDIKKQIVHYGKLLHMYVDKNSVEGNIYLKFTKPEEALAVVQRLKGRVYNGRVLRAIMFNQVTYQIMFPNS